MCSRIAAICLLGVGLLPLASCVVRIIPDDGTPPPPPTTITIRLVNDTGRALDPQFHIGSPDAGVEGLFVAANKRTNFGVGNLGILLAHSSTTFEVNCGELGLFGTQGGIFGDDLNNPLDQGKQAVLQENVNVECGGRVTFIFDDRGNELITSFVVTPAD